VPITESELNDMLSFASRLRAIVELSQDLGPGFGTLVKNSQGFSQTMDELHAVLSDVMSRAYDEEEERQKALEDLVNELGLDNTFDRFAAQLGGFERQLGQLLALIQEVRKHRVRYHL